LRVAEKAGFKEFGRTEYRSEIVMLERWRA